MAAEFHQEGLQHLLELMSARQSVPADYYIGLATDASLAEDAALNAAAAGVPTLTNRKRTNRKG
jgi:hypothetical protein